MKYENKRDEKEDEKERIKRIDSLTGRVKMVSGQL